MVTEILSMDETLPRNIGHNPSPPEENNHIVRLVTLAGTTYANEFSQFAYRMNTILVNTDIRIQVVNCTFLPLSRLLFNNNDQVSIVDGCQPTKCTVCKNDIRNKTGVVKSEVTSLVMHIRLTIPLIALMVVFMLSTHHVLLSTLGKLYILVLGHMNILV